ncbi:MAG TPA: mannosyltransferase family protein [Acidimicrobiia bacterium]|jgi:Gpi18-like mannosyltransferase
MRSRFVREDLRAAIVPWVVSRVVVIVALAMARFLEDELARRSRPAQLAQGLFAWDAAWYRAIAEHGYGFNVQETVRFFPLVPLLSRVLGWAFLDHPDVALVVIANVAALIFAALLHRLTEVETGDAQAAARAAWFGVLLPPAVALVLGYAESTAMALGVGVFLAIRSRRWVVAAVLGLLAGACRPVGVLLVVPLIVEAWTGWRAVATRERVERVLAVVAPLVGMALYLLYVGIEFGDAFKPFSIQNRSTLRGGFEDPFSRLARAFDDMIGGDRFGSGFHVLWALVFLALLVVVIRRLPRSYALYCTVTLVLGLSASNLDSFERYGLSTFPFVMALAIVTSRREVERAVIALGAAGLFGYSLLAFDGRWVP